MAATVFYLDHIGAPGQFAVLAGAEGRHAATVRRIQVGEPITLSDGHGVWAESEVVTAGRGYLELAIIDRTVLEPVTPPVTVVQALPKSDRSELAVELMTEAGADAIVPWQAAHCVARWDGKAVKGVRKWRSAARAAARQSRRAYIPEVVEPQSTTEVLELVRTASQAGALVVALDEAGAVRLVDLPVAAAPEIVLLVGPEGGIADSERAALTAAGAQLTLLGPTVLRTSTAAAVALGAIGALTTRW